MKCNIERSTFCYYILLSRLHLFISAVVLKADKNIMYTCTIFELGHVDRMLGFRNITAGKLRSLGDR